MRRRVEILKDYGRVSREALMKGIGFTADQLEQPFVGVVNGYGELTPGANHLNKGIAKLKNKL